MRSIGKYALAGIAVLASVWLGFGQRSATSLEIEIPFAFTVGKTVLPPGTYRFLMDQNGSRISVSGTRESASVYVQSQLAGGALVQDPTLVFEIVAGSRILSEMWMPGSPGLLVFSSPEKHSHEVIVALPRELRKLTGREAFDHTCRRCHGAGGKGDADADRFFKKTIPRLNSEYVQSKSDEELREIITRGRNDMPPVRLDRPGIGHILPSEAVGAVIAYVRTLKGK